MTRLRRSQLATPANDYKMIENAASSDADQVFLDLEDSTPPGEKEEARENIVKAAKELEWTGKILSFRINSLNTDLWVKDLTDVLSRAEFEAVIIPKVQDPSDVKEVETVVETLKYGEKISFEPQIECGEGLHNVRKIAGASDRNQTLIFGPGDYSAAVGAPGLDIGQYPDYDGHIWHHALSEINSAAKAEGLQCIDGPYADVEDTEGYRRSAENARKLGVDGKWVIHPAQIPIANEVFSPSNDEVKKARKIVEEYREANQEGKGAISVDGQLVDEATIRMAQEVLNKQERIDEK